MPELREQQLRTGLRWWSDRMEHLRRELEEAAAELEEGSDLRTSLEAASWCLVNGLDQLKDAAEQPIEFAAAQVFAQAVA